MVTTALSPAPPPLRRQPPPPRAGIVIPKFISVKTPSSSSSSSLAFPSPSSSPYSHRSSLPPRPHPTRLHAALSPQQPPPESEPPPEKDPIELKGVAATLSKFQDRVQIFFAVFFWLSLFFWASAFDRRNGGSGRRNKGSRFRR